MIDPLLREDPDLDENNCGHCDYRGELVGFGFPHYSGMMFGIICPDCLDAFERENAPEELAITLGDKLSPLEEAEIFAREPLSMRLGAPHMDYACSMCTKVGPDVRCVGGICFCDKCWFSIL